MKKRIYLILSLVWMLPLAVLADSVVQGTVTLNGQTKDAEYCLNGTTARLGSGYNACISQYSTGKVEVPSSITVDGVTYPVTEVSKFAFRMCSYVTEITLPEGITRIGDFAFVSCPSLQKVSLPSTLTTIGAGAFINLPALERIDIYATIPPMWEYNDVFCFHTDGISDTQTYHTDQTTIYVPACGYKLYRTTYYTNQELGWTTPDGWTYFNNVEILDADSYSVNAIFLNEGNWDEASNWNIGAVPQWPDKVLIVSDVVIPDGYVAYADEIYICGGSITIEDGGQLVHNNAGVVATVKKDIIGFEQCSDIHYLLANPVIDEQDPVVLEMTDGDYDLYYFDQSEEPEWRDYKQEAFNLANGTGYLYTKATNANIGFHGELVPSTTDVTVDLAYDAEASLAGFNLVGNPYCRDAYLVYDRDFYILNDNGDEVIVATDMVIAPMQGVLLQALEEETLTFSTTEHSNGDALTISLTHGGEILCDKARVRLGQGRGLEKFQLNTNHDKLYIPLEDKNYAVAFADTMDVMPLNLKVENDSEYTLDFDREGLDFDYLHLIDKLAKTDVDLLETPYYTFDVTDTSYEDRFWIVFNPEWEDGLTAIESEKEAFAFISNGEIHIETQNFASLQIVDMTGRVIFHGDAVNSISTSGLTAGVYVLRLINGNDVKMQKLVVK